MLLASERSKRDTIRGVQIRADAYIYVLRYVCHNSSACHVNVMWAELGHSHFLYVHAFSNVATNGNGTGTKIVLKGTVRFILSLVSSLLSSRRYYYSESKTILYLDTVCCKFLPYVSVEINSLKHRYFSTQTNIAYLGRVYVTIITGTRSESTIVRGVTGVIADFCLELRYIELDDHYQLLGIDTIMAVTKYRKQPTKLSTKKSPKLRSF